MDLTWRQQDVLENLALDQWLRPMDVGGRDGSHHSKTLAGLVKKGLVERKHRPISSAWVYRITEAGEQARREARNQQIGGAAVNAKTYRVTRRHVRGSRIVRELVASGFEYRESAADHITTVIGRPVYPDRYPDGGIAGPDGAWFTVDVERQPRNQQVKGGDE